MIKIVDTKEATNFHNAFIHWIFTLIPISSFTLFYEIDNCIIHNFILPIILLTSVLYLISLMRQTRMFIDRNSEFNHANKHIKSLLAENKQEYSIDKITEYLDIFEIPYKLTDNKRDIFSPEPKIERILIKTNKYTFIISLILFIGLFIYSYCNGLL